MKTNVDAEARYADSSNWYKIDPRINLKGRDLQGIRRRMAEFIIKLQESKDSSPPE